MLHRQHVWDAPDIVYKLNPVTAKAGRVTLYIRAQQEAR
jgi:hypothetical protein